MSKLSPLHSGLVGIAIAAALFTTGCNKEAAPAAEAKKEITLDQIESQVTYIVGYNMAKQAKSNGVEFNQDVMAAAIQDVADDKEPRIAQEEQQKIMMSFQEQQQAKRQAEQDKAGEENLAQSKAFLEENAKKDGVVTTESGLQYKVVSEGPEGGAKPAATDTVKVHYHGTLPDGTVFDSSVDRGEPVSFPVNGVIKGWVEALQLMKVGDKFELFIPSELAYGSGGTGGKIGPNQALKFDVELLEIVKEDAEPEAAPEPAKKAK